MTHFLARLQRVVDAQPDVIAIACAGEPALTYAALWRRAREVATLIGDARIVALHVERSPEFVVGMLAAWLAGAAWVPVLPELPEARRQLIIRETRASIVLVTSERAPVFDRCRAIDLRVATAAPAVVAERSVEDLAYIIYTSGSSGQPKGVLVSHRGLVPMLEAQIAAFDLHAGDRCLWMLSPGFDASVSDVGTALLAGATLCIEHPARLRGDLLEVIRARGITHVDLPPSLLPLLPVEPPPSLRVLVVGGEVCAPAAIRAWAAHVRVVDVYGPTEATVCTSLIVCDPAWERPLLGAPLPHVELAVIDDELWITGPGVADGYLDRPELEAARFVHRDGRRWFRTGDRVRGDELEFVGRIDRQLKIAGVLVAPEEIEARLREHPQVRDAHVVAEEVGTRERLVAYYAADEELDLREHLASRLDARLMPARFVRGDLGNGKRSPAAKESVSGDAHARSIAGTGDVEGALAAIWSRLLGVTPEPGDDFFELGGDSLAVLEHVGLAELARLPMTAEMLYEHRTIAALAAAIDCDASSASMMCDELVVDVALLRETNRAVTSASRGAVALREVRGDADSHILLTGATGFLGSRTVLELLAHSDAPITCIVRDPTALISVLRTIVDGDLAIAAMTTRVRVIAGDLVQPQLGLPPSLYDELVATSQTIVHCAAAVSLAKPYRELRAVNVEGTARVLELAAIAGARVHHASTLSVFVGSERTGILRETDALETAERLHGGYAQSKWAAEWLAREAGATIYRFGLLTGDTRTGRAPARDWLTWFLRGLAQLGHVPDGVDDLAVDLTPVDHAATVLAALVLDDARGTFHVANRRSATLGELTAALRRAGVRIATVPSEAWHELIATADLATPEAAAAVLGISRTARLRSYQVFQATVFTFDTSRTDEVAPCPPPIDELLDRYVRAVL